jgi:hypothetical protein
VASFPIATPACYKCDLDEIAGRKDPHVLTRTARRATAGRLVEAALDAPAAAAERERPLFVVVLGMHRSGTSLCAHLLSALGVDMADDPSPLPSNPKGHWERWEIVGFHNRILNLFDRGYETPLHDLALPSEWWVDSRVAEIKREIVAFLGRKMATGIPFGFKDPRTVRLLPLWRQILSEHDLEVKIVICLRHPAQVARSLCERDGLPMDIGEYRWFTYMAELYEHIDNDDVCTIEYETWFDDTGDNAKKLVRFLGLEKSQAEIIAAVSEIIDHNLRHDDPDLRESAQPPLWSLYKAGRRLDADASARGDIRRIVCQFAAFRALQQGIESEFEQLSGMVRLLLQPARGEDDQPIVTWRDPRIEDAWHRMLSAARRTGSLEEKLKTVLRQRAELDAALARTQQAAALSKRDARAAEQELATLQRRFGISAAAEIAESALVPSIPTALPLGAEPTPAAAAEAIDAVIEQGDPELIDRMIRLRGGEAEFCRLFALKLFEADLRDHARRAVMQAARSFAKKPLYRSSSFVPQMPIFFQYEPTTQDAQDLVLWYRSDASHKNTATSNAIPAYLRWFDCNDRVLVWQSELISLDLTDSRYWQPVVVGVPLFPAQNPWVRFEVLAASQEQLAPLCTGFLFDARRSFDGGTPPNMRAVVLACTDAPPQPALLTDAENPFGTSAADGGQFLTRVESGLSTRCRAPVLITTDAARDTEILFFVDWRCFGKRLATARITSPALSGMYQLVLPAREAASQLFGYGPASGIVSIAP